MSYFVIGFKIGFILDVLFLIGLIFSKKVRKEFIDSNTIYGEVIEILVDEDCDDIEDYINWILSLVIFLMMTVFFFIIGDVITAFIYPIIVLALLGGMFKFLFLNKKD